MILEIKKLNPLAKLPTYAYPGDAGMDIYTTDDYELKPGELHTFSTGIASEINESYVILIWDKSGLGSKGIHRFAGVIDASYRGEWKIALYNSTQENYRVTKGDKIAQALIQKIEHPEIVEVKELNQTARGQGGFGSTGRK